MTIRALPILLLAASLAACGDTEPAPAADANNADAPIATNAAESVRTRQQHYKEIGRAMKAINDELRKDAPDVAAIQAAAATIQRFAPQIEGWFPDGSGAGAGVETEAKAEIWAKPDEFRQATQRLVTAADAFHSTAQTGDLEAIRAGVRDLGGACKNCHDQFRAEKD